MAASDVTPGLPVHPSNEFHKALNALKLEPSKTFNPIHERVSASKWPYTTGAYHVGNKNSPVAVCVLSSEEMLDAFKNSTHLKKVAIVGKLSTENIGIEKIILNTISNPNIRFLILCGQESRGHYAGQAILSLTENGIDDDDRIVGAKGARPFLRNVTKEQIEDFRKQVKVVDLIGNTNSEKVLLQVNECKKNNVEPFSTSHLIEKPEEIVAFHEAVKGFIPDSLGFFTIFVKDKTGEIIVDHYSNDYILRHVLKGKRAEDICTTIMKLGLVSRLDHAAYLGRELQKAEDALRLGHNYEQEKS